MLLLRCVNRGTSLTNKRLLIVMAAKSVGKWHGSRAYDPYSRHNSTAHNIMSIIGRNFPR
jgi:hypothetical protein